MGYPTPTSLKSQIKISKTQTKFKGKPAKINRILKIQIIPRREKQQRLIINPREREREKNKVEVERRRRSVRKRVFVKEKRV
jgi:hypothetical protein